LKVSKVNILAENTTLALRIENVDITGFDGLYFFQVCMEIHQVLKRIRNPWYLADTFTLRSDMIRKGYS
jgi:hypothetical protein